MSVVQHQVAADPQTNPTDLGRESDCSCLHLLSLIAGFPLTWKVGGFCWWSRENGVYHQSCIYFCWKN